MTPLHIALSMHIHPSLSENLDRTPSLSNSDDASNAGDLTPSLPQTPLLTATPSLPSDPWKPPSFLRLRQSSLSYCVSFPRSRTISTLAPPELRWTDLLIFLKIPTIHARFLDHIDWPDFWSFTQTCRETRQLLHLPQIKNVILAHYVPGYRSALRNYHPHLCQDVPITFHDLNLFLISQKVPLHHYPTHALSIISALFPTIEQDEATTRLAALALTHSRFVLLLQSLAHSSNFPIPSEPVEDGCQPLLGVRQLTFPAPLACSQLSMAGTIPPVKQTKGRPASTIISKARPIRYSTSGIPVIDPPKGVRKRRLSLFSNPQLVLPPLPEAEPRALKVYSDSWRRSVRSVSADDLPKMSHSPHRRFATSPLPGHLSPPLHPRSASRHSISGYTWRPPSPPISSSPHDIHVATSRSRAPILRVFIPCTELSDDVIIECENQLLDAGLWDHLSTGDIVCNLGYISSTLDASSFFDSEVSDFGAREGRCSEAHRKLWLVFDGYSLVPFNPLAAPPLAEPLALPSPYYYTHLLPSLVDPLFVFRFPACESPPHLVLVQTVTKLPSPRSPSGYAMVKKYAWMARVWTLGGPGLGGGWLGEWILEGDGTEEGKQVLLNCLSGHPALKVWEFVREKSGGRRVYLRLISTFHPSDRTHVSPNYVPV